MFRYYLKLSVVGVLLYGALRNATSMLNQVAEKNLIGMLGMSQTEGSYNHLPSSFIYLFFPLGSSPNG